MTEATLSLSDTDVRVFNAIVNDERVIVPTSDLRFGREELGGALTALDVAGLIAAFDWGDAPAVSLTPLAAASAGLRAERGRSDYRWVPASSPPRPDRLPGRGGIVNGVALSDMPDHRAVSPVDAAAAREQAAPRARLPLSDRLRPPTVLLEGCRPWVRPDAVPGPCPVCGGRALPPEAYCLLCGAWGLDDVLTRLRAAEVRRVEAARTKAKPPKFRPRARRARV